MRFIRQHLFSPAVKATLTALLVVSFSPHQLFAADQPLPSFGGLGGGLISDQMEAEIGRQVMGSLRRSAPRISDALVNDYLRNLVYRLLPSVPLNDKNITLVIIDNADINAFAVPGNIVGVNGGLFLHASSEQQFAAVLAHELAHLSQRHFARRLEQHEQSAPVALAGMMAGIILSVVTKSDIGIAAIAGTQAYAVQNMLQYSRAHEQEADRIGLEIMADAGMDPRGMPEMFAIMLQESRLQGNQMPEYLSTHPLTQSRVSDTHARAAQYRASEATDDLEYHLMRNRLQVHYAQDASAAIKTLEANLNAGSDKLRSARQYGLAVAHLANQAPHKAEAILQQLLSAHPNRITYQVTLAEALVAQQKLARARSLLEAALVRNPGNTPIMDALATVEMSDGHGRAAAGYLQGLTRQDPQNDELWRRLADAEGLARNIVGVHRAKAEYFILMGDLEAAQRQLQEAQEKVAPGAPLRQVITERLSAVSAALQRRQ
ncbi:M48 family metalloprotease [Marinobacter sp. X15-166B]|uniref:M48 family metalloprotease n=1 Tax=Marinobacter sp. X15-166B TaxID=1897620 RepID=UPI00085C6D8D|nr:M48 family metalloprotease [Marinobacter sp. X15-166B]OEY68055.1 peptidase M48 [Marinobacter sp. X15-166B]